MLSSNKYCERASKCSNIHLVEDAEVVQGRLFLPPQLLHLFGRLNRASERMTLLQEVHNDIKRQSGSQKTWFYWFMICQKKKLTVYSDSSAKAHLHVPTSARYEQKDAIARLLADLSVSE